ncbi:hypothetical protein BBO99_00007259 [Phytophthora kernoviae]|uniref:ApaG domain-containing protein n=1 Tax=Phytophthora kernoviae TaxID=325452 RepID=A0A3R7HAD2_9STRA|nr:hypothetical protein BBI17_007216 [Phytophthora kernoviae]RLN76790.1 hypothetical protein BBO99_00007259 [Phytophthora kernoviae]
MPAHLMLMAKASTVKAIYRCLLRDARELQRMPHFNLRRALRLEQWGVGGYLETSAPLPQAPTPMVLRSLQEFQKLRDISFRMEPPSVDIVQSIRTAFRENVNLSDPKIANLKLDDAIVVLNELSEQLLLAKCSSVTVTDGVRIEATSEYVKKFSNPGAGVYRFTYRVTITNQNEDCSVQILGRQYTFENPGQTFEYASGVDMNAPRGSVTGCLHALRKKRGQDIDDGEMFDAFVSKFALLAPHTR